LLNQYHGQKEGQFRLKHGIQKVDSRGASLTFHNDIGIAKYEAVLLLPHKPTCAQP
jgi:hypothetical protein